MPNDFPAAMPTTRDRQRAVLGGETVRPMKAKSAELSEGKHGGRFDKPPAGRLKARLYGCYLVVQSAG